MKNSIIYILTCVVLLLQSLTSIACENSSADLISSGVDENNGNPLYYYYINICNEFYEDNGGELGPDDNPTQFSITINGANLITAKPEGISTSNNDIYVLTVNNNTAIYNLQGGSIPMHNQTTMCHIFLIIADAPVSSISVNTNTALNGDCIHDVITGNTAPSTQIVFGETQKDVFKDVHSTFDDGYITSGYTTTHGNTERDIMISAVDAKGTPRSTSFCDVLDDDKGSIIVPFAESSNYLVAGTAKSNAQGRLYLFWMEIVANKGVGIDKAFMIGGSSDGSAYPFADMCAAIPLSNGENKSYVLGGYGGNYGTGDDGDFIVIPENIAHIASKAVVFGGTGHEELTSMIATRDGGYVLFGQSISASDPSLAHNDLLVIKLDFEFKILWSYHIGTMGEDLAGKIVEDSGGNFYVSGNFSSDMAGGSNPSTMKIALIRLRADGLVMWSKTYSTGQYDRVYNIEATPTGYAMSGITNASNANGNYDGLLLNVDAQGNLISAYTYGGEENDCINDVSLVNGNGLIMVGENTSSSISNNLTDSDAWLLKSSDNGMIEGCDGNSLMMTVENSTPAAVSFSPFRQVIESGVKIPVSPSITHSNLALKDLCTPNPYAPHIIAGEICGSTNQTVQVPITIQNWLSINSFQFSVYIDPTFATIQGVSDINLSGWTIGDFNINSTNGTIEVIRTLANPSDEESIANNTVLFNIDVQIVGSPANNPGVDITGDPIPIIVMQNERIVAAEIIDEQPCTLFGLSGYILTADNVPLSNVEVEISGDYSRTVLTDETGYYEVADIPAGSTITVTPNQTGQPTNGVDILDVIAIKKHVANISTLSTPYEQMASDENKSGSINTTDLNEIKKVIRLEKSNFFQNQSWRFVPADYDLSNNPLIYPESMTLEDVNADLINQNFTAIKVGDVED